MRPLHTGWTLRRADDVSRPVPATVPGCVHTDLLAAGLIPDPYLDDNEARLVRGTAPRGPATVCSGRRDGPRAGRGPRRPPAARARGGGRPPRPRHRP